MRRVRAVVAATILWAAPAAVLAQAAPPRGFVGLERLEYFERVPDPAARPEIGRLLGPLLPRSLAGPDLRLRGERREVSDDTGRTREFGVRDFRLPPGAGPELHGVARCLFARQRGIVEYRRLDAPSFLERGR